MKEFENTYIYLITSEDDKDNLCEEADGIFSKPLKPSDVEQILKDQFFE